MLTCFRLLKFQAPKEQLSASDNGRVQILCKPARWNRKVPMLLSKICKVFPLLPFILSLIWESLRLLKMAVNRTLAPLRRIVTREMKVFERQRFGSRHPRLFAVIDTLDCGHSFVDHSWSFRDLLCAYVDPTDFPHVTARRHRCHECRDILAAKKPVRSVQIADAVGVAS